MFDQLTGKRLRDGLSLAEMFLSPGISGQEVLNAFLHSFTYLNTKQLNYTSKYFLTY